MENSIEINTTQNVPIDYKVAGIGGRIIAHILDWVLFYIYFYIINLIIGGMSIISNGKMTMIVILLMPVLLYDLLCELLMNGQSIGKMITGIKVIKVDGTQPSIGAYSIRWIFRLVDTISMGGMVALLTIMFNGKGQRLGDIVANTTVIDKNKRVGLENTVLNEVDENYTPMFKSVKALNDRDIAIIRDILNKDTIPDYEKKLNEVATKVKEITGIKDQKMNDEQFLRTVVKDYLNMD
ncbi:MAG: RDD family protein [Flavobacteriales bacterium]